MEDYKFNPNKYLAKDSKYGVNEIINILKDENAPMTPQEIVNKVRYTNKRIKKGTVNKEKYIHLKSLQNINSIRRPLKRALANYVVGKKENDKEDKTKKLLERYYNKNNKKMPPKTKVIYYLTPTAFAFKVIFTEFMNQFSKFISNSDEINGLVEKVTFYLSRYDFYPSIENIQIHFHKRKWVRNKSIDKSQLGIPYFLIEDNTKKIKDPKSNLLQFFNTIIKSGGVKDFVYINKKEKEKYLENEEKSIKALKKSEYANNKINYKKFRAELEKVGYKNYNWEGIHPASELGSAMREYGKLIIKINQNINILLILDNIKKINEHILFKNKYSIKL